MGEDVGHTRRTDGTAGRDAKSAVGRPPDPSEEGLFREALSVAARAYAPYSGFGVGAVVLGASGRRATGVNVENASSPVGQCAERVALGTLVTGGEHEVAAVAVAAADGGDLLPCGACLQALAEFGDPRVVARVGGRLAVMRLHELLRVPFSRRSSGAETS